ncbi:MAG: hypothetical protein JF597_30990 [Streptomyces sp.]|uniref:hypothetical protein n=1 Tax=Streptomyces sp. TaxID=1931 RepID=UPI0025F93B65|nr:hypothetical protein [Streptomyces sp.]MBW8797854.1 hypothetical protein [Streptomyces sp.]
MRRPHGGAAWQRPQGRTNRGQGGTGINLAALRHGTDAQHADSWARRLDDPGVPHSPVRDAVSAEFISAADPDGIAWELWAAKPRH